MNFTYEPLDLSIQEIRLVRMNGFRTDTSPTICCTIQHVSLREVQSYKAVSYMWGNSPTREISINGQCFHVRENLCAFLEVIQGDEDTLFWIDQICIDQFSGKERNHQVAFMNCIYRNASEVMIWLGPAADDSDMAMRAIQRIGSGSRLDPDIPSESKKLKLALYTLLKRPYWYRIWIIQEILLARQAAVWCGNMRLEWPILASFIQEPHEFTIAPVDFDLTTQGSPYYKHYQLASFYAKRVLMLVHAKMFIDEYPPTLTDTLKRFSDSRCKNNRDKVYALIELVPENSRITVDYSKSLEEIVLDVFLKLRESESTKGFDHQFETVTTLMHRMGLDVYQQLMLVDGWKMNGWWRKCAGT